MRSILPFVGWPTPCSQMASTSPVSRVMILHFHALSARSAGRSPAPFRHRDSSRFRSSGAWAIGNRRASFPLVCALLSRTPAFGPGTGSSCVPGYSLSSQSICSHISPVASPRRQPVVRRKRTSSAISRGSSTTSAAKSLSRKKPSRTASTSSGRFAKANRIARIFRSNAAVQAAFRIPVSYFTELRAAPAPRRSAWYSVTASDVMASTRFVAPKMCRDVQKPAWLVSTTSFR